MDELYMEDVVDLYETKAHQGHLQPPTATAELRKQGQTDRVRIDLEIKNDTITKAVYSGFGSVLMQGIAAYLCSRIEGMTVHEATIFRVTDDFRFSVSPSRQECAMLSMYVLKGALDAYSENQSS